MVVCAMKQSQPRQHKSIPRLHVKDSLSVNTYLLNLKESNMKWSGVGIEKSMPRGIIVS